MVKNRIIEDLLKIIEGAVNNLEKKKNITLSEYITNWELQDIVEREFHRAIQSCINIGARIIAQYKFRNADDYKLSTLTREFKYT